MEPGKIVQGIRKEIEAVLGTDEAVDRINTALIEGLREQDDPNGALKELNDGEDELYCKTRDELVKAALYHVYLNY